MNNLEFEQRLEQAFDNNLPIADKVNQLLIDLNNEDLDKIPKDSLFIRCSNDDAQRNNFYQLCQLHSKVGISCEHDEAKTTPVKNTKLWCDSVMWLVEYLDISLLLSRDYHEFEDAITIKCIWWGKWVVNALADDPTYSRERISDDNYVLFHYFYKFGLGTRSIYKIIVMQNIKFARSKDVEEYLDEWLKAPTNDYDDCLACQYDDIIRAYCFLKQYDKALEWAKEILDGSVTCGEVPHATNSLIAEAYFYTNQADKAVAILEKGYPLIQGKMEFLRPISEFIRLYREMNMMDKAVAIFEENKHLLENCESPYEKMLFLIETVKLPIDNKKTYTLEAMSLATQFDLRNGNAYYLSQLPKVIS